MICKGLHLSSMENFVMFELVCRNTIFGELPPEMYTRIKKELRKPPYSLHKRLGLNSVYVCPELNTFNQLTRCEECMVDICSRHMYTWACVRCGADRLCKWCHSLNHRDHASWSDLGYEI